MNQIAMQPKIGVKREFLTVQEQQALLLFARHPDTVWRETVGTDPWHNRTIPHVDAPDEIRALMTNIRSRAIALIQRAYKLKQPLYADSFAMTRWRLGEDQKPHADSENLDGSPHPYPWRQYGAIMYLNTDYEGGQLIFPQHGVAPVISAGMLAFFPGDRHHVHGVTPIERGVRYTLAMFLTHDKMHADWA